ncbi:DUF2442 domain-containing protein [Thiohalophilus thiocyanatoxydans]|uniref:Uncharacterized protein DUF2442 n=1 Tax=Thiohalophilus thiocyanatoxydans TaxID=381308 RepID=A0A4R8IQ35_9GAMM|nr:DUF2442 domain-containing protein [Thiohalophilus thiocyanatoxydans]TDX99558.1 uncharacterized protein DUF2442 [Thiohalophilus thiocyanatoxydans]
MPAVELTNVSAHGFWLLWNGEEHFLAFEDFPWFRDASIAALSNIELQGAEHLYWPDLDVDLSLAIIKRPEDYPLESKG